VEIKILKALKEQENFFHFESVNPHYFENGESQYFDNYKALFGELKKELQTIIRASELDLQTHNQLLSIEKELGTFDSLFQKAIQAIRKRGFKNFGIEGEMREAVHQLEEIRELSLEHVLTLRRHEKDFIIRQDPYYVEMHHAAVNELKQSIENSTEFTPSKKKAVIAILMRYSSLFDQVAMFERMIGLKSNSGLKKAINKQTNDLLSALKELKIYSEANQESLIFQLNLSVLIFWLVYIIIVLFLSVRLANKFTYRLQMLSKRINYFVNANFTAQLQIQPPHKKDEVGKLWDNFIKMEREIVEYIELFKEKVDEKTLELSFKNEKIELQKKELEAQKKVSDQKNKDLMDGMKYGWRIQRAMLPSSTKLKKQLGNSFVFFQPKDIVSGDIYWTHRTKEKSEEVHIFSVIDCTGHGVPGAFMSILAVNAVNNAVLNKQLLGPSKILKATNTFVYNTMKYYVNNFKNDQPKDGMDMILCKLNRKEQKVEFAGANRSLLLVRDEKDDSSLDVGVDEDRYKRKSQHGRLLFEFFPIKKTVGTLSDEESDAFDSVSISIQKGDMLYLTSDGYADQFGGPKNKKFLSKRLKNVLMLIHDLNCEEQQKVVKQTFIDWKGDAEQIDDICLMGVRV
jgi:serine phosphatase RsbU (regulator of sigma subunit)